jgi:hypothetical protein
LLPILLAEEMIRRGTTLALCCALLVAVVSGCAGTSDTTGSDAAAVSGPAAVVAESAGITRTAWLERGSCHQGDANAAPAAANVAADDTLLTVSGSSTAGPVAVSMGMLDAMSQVTCTVNDRQGEGKNVVFSGVLLADVLAAVGVGDATTLHTSAQNDYAVDIPMSDVVDVPVLLATRADGAEMSVANYGPLRVVYPTTGYQLDPAVYDPRWIWQLTSIDVK